jgi:hypothetical protein|tara:strand:- start:58 stop:426 length:369 start_codon:yes stop_codon:yes gene_type:complete
MTSVLNVDTIANKAGSGPVALTKQVAAKMHFGINGSDASIRQSFNVSSTTDDGTGDYDITVTNAFANQMDDSGLAMVTGGGTRFGRYSGGDTTTTVFSVRAHDSGGTKQDAECNGAAFGDLA